MDIRDPVHHHRAGNGSCHYSVPSRGFTPLCYGCSRRDRTARYILAYRDFYRRIDCRGYPELLDRALCGSKGPHEPLSRPGKKEYIDRTYGYYEKYGGKTIFIARFIPLVRTFAPFLAGVGQMAYKKFLLYNVLGAVTWVLITTLAGYLLGSHPVISENINILIYGVIAVTLVTVILIFAGLIRSFLHRKTPVR